MDELAEALTAPALGGYVRNRMASGVDDLLQDLYVEMTVSGRRPDRVPLAIYVRAAAHHQICKRIDAATRQRARVVAIDEQRGCYRDTAPSALDGLLDRERLGVVRKCLEVMDPIERAILQRFYFDGQPHEEIEAELKLSPTSFRLRKCRALKRLRALCVARMNRGKVAA